MGEDMCALGLGAWERGVGHNLYSYTCYSYHHRSCDHPQLDDVRPRVPYLADAFPRALWPPLLPLAVLLLSALALAACVLPPFSAAPVRAPILAVALYVLLRLCVLVLVTFFLRYISGS